MLALRSADSETDPGLLAAERASEFFLAHQLFGPPQREGDRRGFLRLSVLLACEILFTLRSSLSGLNESGLR